MCLLKISLRSHWFSTSRLCTNMAFKTGGLAATYLSIQSTSLSARSFSSGMAVTLSQSDTSADAVIQIMVHMKTFIEALDAASAVNGIAQYAKDQTFDQNYDVVAEFVVMRAAAQAVMDWVIEGFPTSTGGFIEKDTLEVDGSITVRTFTPTQTSSLRTVLNTLISSIEI
jgi:hypothetical protein